MKLELEILVRMWPGTLSKLFGISGFLVVRTELPFSVDRASVDLRPVALIRFNLK